jgi:hypothetical protein
MIRVGTAKSDVSALNVFSASNLRMAVWVLAGLLALGLTAGAKPQASSASVPAIPRMSDGQPDMQGFWGTSKVPESVAFDIEGNVPPEEGLLQGHGSLAEQPDPANVIVDPPIPYQPWAAILRDENRKHSLNPTKREEIDSESRCLQRGVPRTSLHVLTFQILQVPGYVILLYGSSNGARVIPLDGRAHIGGNIKLWAGDSVGHWDGHTLVVDVTNINEHGWYDWAGNFHSNELHLVERWKLVDSKTIDYEVTSDDPKVFTRPWTMKLEYARNKNQNAEQLESACYEGEKDIEVMLQHNQQQDPLK